MAEAENRTGTIFYVQNINWPRRRPHHRHGAQTAVGVHTTKHEENRRTSGHSNNKKKHYNATTSTARYNHSRWVVRWFRPNLFKLYFCPQKKMWIQMPVGTDQRESSAYSPEYLMTWTPERSGTEPALGLLLRGSNAEPEPFPSRCLFAQQEYGSARWIL